MHGTRFAGAIVADGRHVADTMQCCHCGMHWQVIYGSGRIRGWCKDCNKPTCGKHACNTCMPYKVRALLNEVMTKGDIAQELVIRKRFPGIIPL